MHAVHRSHLPHIAAIGAACAALAVVLTLLVAGTLNDFGSVSASGSAAAAPTSVPPTSMDAGFNLNPFTSLLRLPAPVPWSAGS